MMKTDRFTRGSRTAAGAHRRYQYARCGACLAVGEVNDTSDTWHPPEAVAKKLVQRGWYIGKTAAKDRCPKCNKPAPTAAAQGEDKTMPVASYDLPKGALASLPDPVLGEIQATVPVVKAEPPREPTLVHRRLIRETLELRYDESKGCYIADQSDEKLAESLQVPRAWVTQVREAGGYGPDINEACAKRADDLRELGQRLEDLEAKAMALLKSTEEKLLQFLGEIETAKADLRKASA